MLENRWRAARRLGLVLGAGGMLGGSGVMDLAADELEAFPPQGERREAIARRIAELDDEKFAVREAARVALLEIGMSALPMLVEATGSDSPEQRVRARQLVDAIHAGRLREEFAALGKRPDGEVDVEHGMWLIATILDPGLARGPLTAALDEMAEAVRKAAGEEVRLPELPPMEAMRILTGVLKDDFGLHGDVATYDHPDNSSLHRVLARKKGLPILLSEIAVAVARRVDLPVVGLSIPGRYMIKYDGKRAPGGVVAADLIINPFDGWQVMTVEELTRSIPGFDPGTDLEPSPARETLVRMLSNLSADLFARGGSEKIAAIREYQILLMPDWGLP